MKYTFLIPIAVATISLLLPFQASSRDKGGLFVEPGLTYQISTASISYPAPFTGSSNADNNGFGLMARLGFHISESFFIAADGRYTWSDFEDDDYKTDAIGYNLAPVLGIQMSEFGLRVWGSYVLTGEMDPAENNGLDMKFQDAQGYRLGVGFRIFSLSLNLEYEDLSYERSEFSGGGVFTGPSSDLKLDTETYILSVSFPLEL